MNNVYLFLLAVAELPEISEEDRMAEDLSSTPNKCQIQYGDFEIRYLYIYRKLTTYKLFNGLVIR